MRHSIIALLFCIILVLWCGLCAKDAKKPLETFAYGFAAGICFMIGVFFVIDLITGNMIFIRNA